MAPLDVDTARYYASQILVALDHIHSKEVVHRYVKAACRMDHIELINEWSGLDRTPLGT